MCGAVAMLGRRGHRGHVSIAAPAPGRDDHRPMPATLGRCRGHLSRDSLTPNGTTPQGAWSLDRPGVIPLGVSLGYSLDMELRSIPPVPLFRPGRVGHCWCGCGTSVAWDKQFVQGHDKVALGALLKAEYGGLAGLLLQQGHGPYGVAARLHPRQPVTTQAARDALDAAAEPLPLRLVGAWDPAEHRPLGQRTDRWAVALREAGPRLRFDFEDVYAAPRQAALEAQPAYRAAQAAHQAAVERGAPAAEVRSLFFAVLAEEGAVPLLPIDKALDERNATGDLRAYRRAVEAIIEAEPRDIDAHAHLGNLDLLMVTGDNGQWAIRGFTAPVGRKRQKLLESALGHYEAGVVIGESSFPHRFGGCIEVSTNRPWSRAAHGLLNATWALGMTERAAAWAESLVWLDPGDAVAQSSLPRLLAGMTWEEAKEAEERDYMDLVRSLGPSARPAPRPVPR